MNRTVSEPWRMRPAMRYLQKSMPGLRCRVFCQQPLWLIALKTICICTVAWLILKQAPVLGGWFEAAVGFFRIPDIFKITMPERHTFDHLALLLLAVPVAGHGGLLLLRQLEAVFSAAGLDSKRRSLVYIRNNIVNRELCVIDLDDLQGVSVRQILPARLFRVGTLSFRTREGEDLELRSLAGAQRLVAEYYSTRSRH